MTLSLFPDVKNLYREAKQLKDGDGGKVWKLISEFPAQEQKMQQNDFIIAAIEPDLPLAKLKCGNTLWVTLTWNFAESWCKYSNLLCKHGKWQAFKKALVFVS